MSYTAPLVAVVGGAGYIGAHVVRQLLEEGYRVRVFDNFHFGNQGVEGLDHPDLEIVEGDICDTLAVTAALKDAEAVILLAAIVGHRAEDIRYAHYRDINFLASNVVLDAAVEHGANRFIFASTDSVYGTQPGVYFETGTPEPVSLYSRLKLRMEERVMNSKRRDFHPTVLRVGTCYGYSPRMRFDLVVNGLVRDAMAKGIVTVRGGAQVRALIHVADAARAFVSCLKAHVNLVSGETFNVTAKNQVLPIQHLVNTLKTLRPNLEVQFVDSDPDLIDYSISSSKIEKILDFSPAFTVQMGMEDLIQHFESGEFKDPYSLLYQNT